MGWESHLDDYSYTSSEILPVGFNIYRKDQTAGVEGGVEVLDTDAELNYLAKINLHNSPSLYICSYYQPPHYDLILELNESI